MVKKVVAEEASVQAVREVTMIEPLMLEEHFANLPGDLARFNELYAQALRKFLQAKRIHDREWSRIYLEMRESGEKKTETALKAEVEIDDTYQSARQAMVLAEVDKVRLGGIVEAIRAKKDALISLGANLRAEMSGSPSIRDRVRGARDVEDSRNDE